MLQRIQNNPRLVHMTGVMAILAAVLWLVMFAVLAYSIRSDDGTASVSPVPTSEQRAAAAAQND